MIELANIEDNQLYGVAHVLAKWLLDNNGWPIHGLAWYHCMGQLGRYGLSHTSCTACLQPIHVTVWMDSYPFPPHMTLHATCRQAS